MSAATEVKSRPILFSGSMVRAVLGGHKTQTRRLVKWPKNLWFDEGGFPFMGIGYSDCRPVEPGDIKSYIRWPYGSPGDRLWAKEAAYIAPPNFGDPGDGKVTDYEGRRRVVGYAASMGDDSVRCAEDYGVKKTPSIHMARWASRITLEITEVRVERLNSISESDCWAEGIDEIDGMFSNAEIIDMANRIGCCIDDAKPTYACLWEKINGPGSWDLNPWVWVVSFNRITGDTP